MTKIWSRIYLPYMVVLALIGTVMPTVPAQAGLFSLSEEEEIRAGREVAAQAEKEFGRALPSNHPMSMRVRALGEQFARLSVRRNIPYSYKVLDDTSRGKKVLNAFAAPGGPIFVTRTLVETTANDAELAYVLGHETAHIDRKHIVKSVEKQQKVGLGVGILGAILGRGRGGNIIGAIGNVAFTVWSRGYSRDHENESDVVGVRWMSQLGYDPRAAISMLDKLGGGRSSGGLDKYLSTHPAPKDRQDNVNRLIARESLLEVARRRGGPRLSSGINYGSDAYESYPSYARYPSNGYPADDRDDSSSYPSDYPSDDDGSPAYYPSDDDVQPTYRSGRELDFGAPLRLRPIGRGNEGVVLAPVNGFARWAGASVSTRGRSTIMRRGNASFELMTNSTVAYLDGRAVTLSAPPQFYGNVLYAPLGPMADAVGAQASVDEDDRVVRLSINGRSGFVRLP